MASRLRKYLSVRPVFRKLNRSAHQLTAMLLKLFFKTFEKRKSICGRPGKAADDGTIVQPSYLFGVWLHHRLTHRYLAVARNHDFAVFAY